MHFFFVLKLLDIRTTQASKNVPVDVPQIVARRIISEVRKVRAAAALARQVLAPTAIGQPTKSL